MSTPGDQQLPLFGDIPQGHLDNPIPSVEPPANQLHDLSTDQQKVADLSQQFHEQLAASSSLLDSMANRMGNLAENVQKIPEAFASTADHIQRSVAATNDLAEASRRVTREQKSGQSVPGGATSPGGLISNALFGGLLGGHGRGGGAANVVPGEGGNPNFKVGDLLHWITTGQVTRILDEAFQKINTDPMKALGERLQASGRGRMTGTGSYADVAEGEQMTIPGITAEGEAAAPGMLARLGGLAEMGAGTGLIGLATGIGAIPAAGLYAGYKIAMENQRQWLETGRLTGEGRGAGLAAEGIHIPFIGNIGGEVGTLRGSPFDLIGNAQAQQIVQGIRGAGFRGANALPTEEAVANIVNQLGVDVPEALQITIAAIKDADMSTGDLTSQMDSLAKTARDSGSGIQSLTQTVGQMIESLAGQSREAAQQSTSLLQALMQTFQGTEVGRHPEAFAGLIQEGAGRQALALLSGFAPFQDFTRAFTQNFNTEFNRMLVTLAAGNFDAQGRQQMDWNSYVRMILLNPLYQQLFSSFSVPQVVDLLSTAAKGSNQGRNPNAFIQPRANANAANRASESAAGIASSTASLFNSKTSFWDKGFFSHSPFGNLFGNSGGVDRSLVRRRGMQAERQLAQAISGLGLSTEERNAILDPVIKAAQAGDRGGVQKALSNAAKQIQADQKAGEVKVNVQVGFDPTSSRMLKSWNQAKISALRGQGGTQGANIHSEP